MSRPSPLKGKTVWMRYANELEIEVENFKSDAYVLDLLTKIDELEAWQKCVRLWAPEVAQVADEEQMAALQQRGR